MKSRHPSFQLVDTHCHLDLFKSTPDVLEEIETQRILTVAVTNAPFLFENTHKLSQKSDLVIPALGLHPELVATHGNQLDEFHRLLDRTRFVGEVGLDYVTKDDENREQQRKVFESIISACAEAGDKVITIHSRRSAADVLSIIGDRFPGTIILHWYSGSLRDLRKAIEIGCYFSVNSAMVRSESGQRIVLDIPLDRLLTETDGPFAKHKRLPATPRTISATIDGIATLLATESSQICQLIQKNTFKAFGWTGDAT